MKNVFAAAVNCIDGRAQIPVIEYLKRALGVDFVDMITEPGACGVLAENRNEGVVSTLKNKVGLSIRRHGTKVVAVAGHHGCAAYPKTRKEQTAALLAAREVIGSWSLEIRVMLLWVGEDGSVTEVG